MARSNHEVVTLQLGHYSNFVGTHWWNIQEASFMYDPKKLPVKEINHNVLFREGQNLLGEVTYTPRLVSVDLKDSLNTLKQEGTLYEIPESADEVNWSSDVTMHKGISVPKNEFLRDIEEEERILLGQKASREADRGERELDEDAASEKKVGETPVFGRKLYYLDDCVNVWSDYLRIHLHPKTVCIVEQYTHDNPAEPFDVFTQGLCVYQDEKLRHALEDRLHFFLEECDHLQGLHILADIYDGFGGFSAALLIDLEDELENKSTLVFGMSPPIFNNRNPVQNAYRIVNMALTFEKLANHGSAFLPLSLASSYSRKQTPSVVFPYVSYKADLPYHTSAVLATALDTLTLPHRLDRPPSLLSHLTQAMTPVGRKVLSLHHALPFPLAMDSTVVDTLLNLGDTLPWQSLTPGCPSNANCMAQSFIARGIPAGKLKGMPNSRHHQVLNACDTLDEVMSLYLKDMCNCSLNAICSVQDTCKVTAPFPHIFKPVINKHGLISNVDRPKDTGVESVPVMTSLQATSAVQRTLKSLLNDVKTIDVKRFHKVLGNELEEDDYKESINNLNVLMDNYIEEGQDVVS